MKMIIAQFLYSACSRKRGKREGMNEEVPNQTVQSEPLSPAERNAAQKVQKMYRSYRTRRRLADSVVIAEELWWQALDYARLKHNTISFFDQLHQEPAASRWTRVAINASKIGHGLTEDYHARTLAFQHWIEAIDPRHRYGHNLEFYYKEWCNSRSQEPFFYWLDVGEGRNVDLKECSRSKLRQQCVTYLGPQEREHYEYVIKDGRVVRKQFGVFLDTRKDSKEEKWIFVVSSEKKIYAGVKKKGSFHHSSFLAGGATIAAGRLTVHDGYIKSISAHSGHYRPEDENIDAFIDFLQENGVDLNEVEVIRSKGDYEEEPKQEQVLESDNRDYEENLKQEQVPEFHEPEIHQQTTSEEETTKPNEVNNKDVVNSRFDRAFDRTMSGLQFRKTWVTEEEILKRINARKEMNSYQLGYQLPRSWSTGAGPRIGCVADYPMELRAQALEFVFFPPSKPIHA